MYEVLLTLLKMLCRSKTWIAQQNHVASIFYHVVNITVIYKVKISKLSYNAYSFKKIGICYGNMIYLVSFKND